MQPGTEAALFPMPLHQERQYPLRRAPYFPEHALPSTPCRRRTASPSMWQKSCGRAAENLRRSCGGLQRSCRGRPDSLTCLTCCLSCPPTCSPCIPDLLPPIPHVTRMADDLEELDMLEEAWVAFADAPMMKESGGPLRPSCPGPSGPRRRPPSPWVHPPSQPRHGRDRPLCGGGTPLPHQHAPARAPERWERWERVPSQFEILAATFWLAS